MNLTITGSNEIFDLEVLIVVQSINVDPPKQPFWKNLIRINNYELSCRV